MKNYLFTSESVGIGHPDKVADQISDAILDECLRQDSEAKVAAETMVSKGVVIIFGEITTTAQIDYQELVRKTIKDIGYKIPHIGFDYETCGILISIQKQSPDIEMGVIEGKGLFKEQGAGDQGIMFGFASDETEELMPLPIMLANKIVQELNDLRKFNKLSYLLPDAKAQVTVEYDSNNRALRVHTIVISTQHQEGISRDLIVKDMKEMVHRILPSKLLDANTFYYINPTGRFVVGGPAGDSGLTGRKIIVDTYGGMARHGGGAFSGKDPSKVDRSASYAARYVAKNIVAAKLAKKCEIQLSYAIGVPYPISVKVDTFGTATKEEGYIEDLISKVFDLTPKGIIQMLDLKRPIYQKTAFGGHFGRNEPEFSWEKTDKVEALLGLINEP